MPPRRRTQRRVVHLAGLDGDLFVNSDGLARHQVLDGDELYGYPDLMAARSAWWRCRLMTWSHPSRAPWRPPVAAVVFDGLTSAVDGVYPLPPQGHSFDGTLLGRRWNSKAFAAAVRTDVASLRKWRRAEQVVGPLAIVLDDYEAGLAAAATALRSVDDVEQAVARFGAVFSRRDLS